MKISIMAAWKEPTPSWSDKIIQHNKNGERNQKKNKSNGFFYYTACSIPVLLIMIAL